MKSYTDINQSKKLAEILPNESADMCFNTHNNMPPLMTPYSRFKEFYDMEPTPDFLIPCWSLAALLNAIPLFVRLVGSSKPSYWYCECIDSNVKSYLGESADTPIDSCYNLILKLRELNLL